MQQARESIIIKINRIFGKSLVDFSLLKQYYQISGKQLTSEFNKLLAKNKVSEKIQHAAQIAHILSPLINQSEESLIEKLSSTRKTEITKKITKILIPQKSIRSQFQSLRANLIKRIRQNEKINIQHVEMFRLFYSLFNTEDDNDIDSLLRKESSDELSDDQKKLKTILTSIKKMTGIDPKQVMPKDKNPYYLNIDIKNILQKVSKQIKSKKVSEKLKQYLESAKSGKWFGPRLAKQLQAQKWKFEQIRILIENLKTIKIYQRDLQSKIYEVNRTKKKMIQNLQNYLNKLIKKNQSSYSDNEKERQQYEEDQLNQYESVQLEKDNFQLQKIDDEKNDKQDKKLNKPKKEQNHILKINQFDDDYALLRFMMEDDRKLFNDGSEKNENSRSPPKITSYQTKKLNSQQRKKTNNDQLLEDFF